MVMVSAPSPLESAASRILLALGERTCPPASLVRTFELARHLGAAVEVLRVLPDPLRWFRWLPRAVLQKAMQRQMERSRARARATRYELTPVYGAEPRRGQVVVRTGAFVREVSAHAKRRSPTLIVVPPDRPRLGSLATRLALAAGCRVFVPRPAARRRAMLAASDLATRGLPVLREGTRLAAPLRLEMLSFHNVDPLSEPADDADELPRSFSLTERMERARASLSALGPAAVRSGIDAAQSILAEAHESQVDLIVVGVKARTRLERLIYGSVASRVVERARCSVVVAPVRSWAGGA